MSGIADLVIHNARIMTCNPERLDLGIVERGAVAISSGAIAWVGRSDERPRGERELDAGGRLVTPGLVDCHTHLVYAGDRAHEFELRLAGASYEEIARAGGGIVSTVKLPADHSSGSSQRRPGPLLRLVLPTTSAPAIGDGPGSRRMPA